MTSSQIPQGLISFCEKCRKGLSDLTENRDRVELFKKLMPDLLRNTSLFKEILSGIVGGKGYPDLKYAAMFDSELILYTDPDHLFSIRMFMWKPQAYDPIHDHNSWGIVGPISGELEVVNYKRIDDGSREGYAELVVSDRGVIKPGETYSVLPLNAGIHKTGNPTQQTIVQISVYGELQTTRNYINGYDIVKNHVYPIYAPKIKKKQLAALALANL